MLSHTRTFVEMPVNPAIWWTIRKLLIDGGYEHAVDDKEGTLDMHGIAMTKAPNPSVIPK